MSRPIGSKNKRTLVVAEAVEEEVPGFNPIVLMAKFAADESNVREFRFECAKAVAPYLAPRLKASENKHDFTVGLADRVARIKRAEARLETYEKAKAAAPPREVDTRFAGLGHGE